MQQSQQQPATHGRLRFYGIQTIGMITAMLVTVSAVESNKATNLLALLFITLSLGVPVIFTKGQTDKAMQAFAASRGSQTLVAENASVSKTTRSLFAKSAPLDMKMAAILTPIALVASALSQIYPLVKHWNADTRSLSFVKLGFALLNGLILAKYNYNHLYGIPGCCSTSKSPTQVHTGAANSAIDVIPMAQVVLQPQTQSGDQQSSFGMGKGGY